MGLALAELLLADGARVTIAGRSAERLAVAAKRLDRPDRVRAERVDIGREDQVRRLLAAAAPVHHIAVTAVDARNSYAPVAEFELDHARAVLDTKLLGPWLVAKHAGGRLAPTGSITFTGGVVASRPSSGSSIASAANGALESLAKALAVDLAPIRVNVVAPGWTDTPLWDTIAGDQRGERLAGMAERLLLGRVGRPEDIASAITELIRNSFITGTVLHVDGGQQFV